MPRPSEHPEGVLEQRRLADVAKYVRRTLNLIASAPAGFGRLHELEALANNQRRQRDSLLQALDTEPYFGRMDFWEKGEDSAEEYYVTRSESVSAALYGWSGRVVSWRSPFGGAFYERSRRKIRISVPGGELQGDVLLRRAFTISACKLERIDDLFDVRKTLLTIDDPSPTESKPHILEEIKLDVDHVDPDEFLRLVLEGKRGRGLKEVVASIQERQNELIRADSAQILVIQGAAGSGKTTIALHRIAILTYESERMTNGPRRRILSIGPNNLFLQFVSQVLPDLEVEGVEQQTFVAWASNVTGIPFIADAKDLTLHRVFNPLLDKEEMKVARREYRISQEKGKLTYLHRLTKYVDGLRVKLGSIVWNPAGADVFPDLSCSVSEEEMEFLIKSTMNMPVNRQRDRVVEVVAGHLFNLYAIAIEEKFEWLSSVIGSSPNSAAKDLQDWKQLIHKYGYDLSENTGEITLSTLDERLRQRQRRLKRIRDDARVHVERHFERLSALDVYIDFLGVSEKSYALRLEDVAPVTHLHMQLEGFQPNLDHIVVDEAQDMSPAELFLLRKAVTIGSMTILGDLPQSIHSYRGISRWDEIEDVFRNDRFTIETISVSYRATFEIMRFATKVLQTSVLGKMNYSAPEPFARHGRKVAVTGVSDEEAHRICLANEIQRLVELRTAPVALICSDIEESKRIYNYLENSKFSCELVIAEDVNLMGEHLVVIPAFLAKGLEWDACIVVDASIRKYPSDVRYGRLFYVAVTRAIHELVVLWIGAPSEHLPKEHLVRTS